MSTLNQANDVPPRRATRPPRSTSPLLWTATMAVFLVLLLLRSQQLHGIVAAKVAETGAAKELTDPALTELSVNIGFYLGVVISGVLAALYLSLASIAESTFFAHVSLGQKKTRIGVLGAAAIVSLLSVQLISLLLSIPSPKDHWVTYVYVGAVGVGIPWIFRHRWAGMKTKSVIFLFAASLALAVVSLAL